MLRYALGGIVLLASTHSAALSLGGHSGQAVIGRALDMQVRSNASMAELEAAACLEARVSYGDVSLPSTAVSIQLQPGPEGALIRVRANLPVNEPVVTVLLRAGCSGDTFSRRYVLLADVDLPTPASAAPATLPAVVVPPAAPAGPQTQPVPTPAPAPAASLPAARSAPAPSTASPSTPRAARPAAPAPAPRAAAPSPAPRPAPAPAPRVAAPTPAPAVVPAPAPAATPRAAAPAPAAPARGPRLELDPVDLAPQGAPTLRSSIELQSTPTDSEERRKAAQALWAALNAPPEQLIQDAQKLATLEQEVQGLRTEEQKLKASIETLQRELQQAREERTPGWMLALLGAALLAALAALLWLMRERRRAVGLQAATGPQPWWQSSQMAEGEGPGQALSDMAQAESGWSAPLAHGPGDTGVEVSEATESSFAVLHEETPADVDALVDLNQHCEFFESLGQRADAVALLEDFVGRHPSASELPYLWLLRLSDEQGRNDERLRWARRYEQVFGRAAPASEALDRAAGGVLEQPRLLADLEALWPSEKAQDLLRQTAVARPGMSAMSRPSLVAYQDVLLLLTLLQSLPPQDADAAPAPEAWPSVAAPLAAPLAAEPAAFEREVPTSEPASLDLDLDLTIPDAAPPPPLPDNAPPAEAAEPRRELPMLDFDVFELEPRPGEAKDGKTDDKA